MQTPLMIYSDLYDRNDDKNSKNMQMTLVFMVKSAKLCQTSKMEMFAGKKLHLKCLI